MMGVDSALPIVLLFILGECDVMSSPKPRTLLTVNLFS